MPYTDNNGSIKQIEILPSIGVYEYPYFADGRMFGQLVLHPMASFFTLPDLIDDTAGFAETDVYDGYATGRQGEIVAKLGKIDAFKQIGIAEMDHYRLLARAYTYNGDVIWLGNPENPAKLYANPTTDTAYAGLNCYDIRLVATSYYRVPLRQP